MKNLDLVNIYKLFFKELNEGLWLGDEKLDTLYVNPKACELSGYSFEELIGKNALDLLDSRTKREAQYFQRKNLKEPIRLSYEGFLIRKDGTKIPINLSSTVLLDGKTFCVFTDLRKQKSRESIYKTLVEQINEAIWIGDDEGHTIYINPKYSELTGYSLEERITKKTYGILDEKTKKIMKLVDQKNRMERSFSDYEGCIIAKNKELIPVRFNSSPLPEKGRICIVTDLREQKQKESIYKKLVENMNEAVWMGDKNEKTIYANPKFCELVGYEQKEIIGNTSYRFWDEESRKRVLNVNLNERKKGISSSYEGVLLNKNKEKIPVFLSGTSLPEGGTIGIMTDLRQLKAKEATEMILKKAVEHSSDAIIITNYDLKVKFWNQGAKILFGYKKKEIIEKSLSKIFDLDIIKRYFEQKKLNEFELNGIHKNKKHFPVSVTFTSQKKDKKSNSSYLIIARDISQQTKIEEELLLKYEKIKDAYNYLGVMRRQKDYIFELLDFANSSADEKSLANFIVNSIIMLTKVDASHLCLYNPKTNITEMLASFGLSSDWLGQANKDYEGSFLQKAFEQRMPLKILDLARKRKEKIAYLARKDGLTSALIIPLIKKDKLVGCLALYVKGERKLEIFENSFIEKYAKIIALVIADFNRN